MFFVFSKILNFLISPFSWITITLILTLLYRKKSLGKRFLIVSIVLLFFFGNEFIANEIMSAWEGKPVSFSEYKSEYDVAVILGGVTRTDMEPRDRVYFDRGADRIVHPLFLFRMGKIKKFLVSGGTGRLVNPKYSEAPALAKALVLFGVPKEDVLIESNSRNTHENAVFSKDIISKEFPRGVKILLVTSAFHMKRAKGCFAKSGLEFDVLKTDFLAHPRQFTPDILILPSYNAFFFWNKLNKEWLGMIAYKIAGYL